MCQKEDIRLPVVKCTTAIAAAGGANTASAEAMHDQLMMHAAQSTSAPEWLLAMLSLPWGHIASMCAAVYTTVLLLEWIWKKPMHWAFVKIGWKEPTVRYTQEEWVKRLHKGE